MSDAHVDPDTPAWVLDIVQDMIRDSEQRVIDHMLNAGEDVTDVLLWRHRRGQFRSLLASVIAEYEGSPHDPAPCPHCGTVHEGPPCGYRSSGGRRMRYHP